MRALVLLTVFALFLPFHAHADTAAAAADIDAIIELAKAGASDSVVIKTVQNSGKVYSLAAGDVVRLKKAGVSDPVLEAMLDTASRTKPTSAPARPGPVTSTGGPSVAGDREPTEQEMFAAIKAGVDSANAFSKNTEASCRNGSAKNDPTTAMLCLAGALGTGGAGGIGVEVSNFHKVACARASGVPGWNCDYVQSTNVTGLLSSNSPLAQALGPDIIHGRFVYTNGRWVRIQ